MKFKQIQFLETLGETGQKLDIPTRGYGLLEDGTMVFLTAGGRDGRQIGVYDVVFRVTRFDQIPAPTPVPVTEIDNPILGHIVQELASDLVNKKTTNVMVGLTMKGVKE